MRVLSNDLCPTTLKLSITVRGKQFAARCSAAEKAKYYEDNVCCNAVVLGF